MRNGICLISEMLDLVQRVLRAKGHNGVFGLILLTSQPAE